MAPVSRLRHKRQGGLWRGFWGKGGALAAVAGEGGADQGQVRGMGSGSVFAPFLKGRVSNPPFQTRPDQRMPGSMPFMPRIIFIMPPPLSFFIMDCICSN